MTKNNPDTVLAAGGPKAKIVSLISAARDVHEAAAAKREPPADRDRSRRGAGTTTRPSST